MNLFKAIEKEIHAIIRQKIEAGTYPADLNYSKVEVTPPRDPAHGDMATNAALILAPQFGKNAKAVAEDLHGSISGIKSVATAQIAGPGFINITLDNNVWQEALLAILDQGIAYGDSTTGQGQRINIEFVSANPTGPMHVGHGRGAVYGDALATLLAKVGFDVTREYYINDAGAQIDKLVQSVFERYRELCGKPADVFPEGLYPGEYLIPVAETFYRKHSNKYLNQSTKEWWQELRELTLSSMMQLIKDDLEVLGIKHDVFTSEREITEQGKVEQAIAKLEQKNFIYRGILEPPKGKTPDDWEPREQTLFRSTEFGDDCDRPVKKSDGSWTYFAPDIAYHFDKCTRGFTKLIDIFGADHGGYVKRIKAVVKALSDDKIEVDVKLCQLVKFMRDGEPLKMSKRAGTFVTVREVVDEVGKDVFRFIMLTRKNDVPLDFDFAKVMEQSKDNPVFYVQYAHARAHSIIRRAAEELPEAIALLPLPRAGEGRGGGATANASNADPLPRNKCGASSNPPPYKTGEGIVARLIHPEELALIRLMCNWPRLIESAALGLEPHRIAFYLQELAAAFHSFWNSGNDDITLRFLQKHDIELSAARIVLARTVSLVIASGLTVLGVEPLEEMR